MLRPRIIPCLLLQNGSLVKTVGFKNPKYIGDPINAVRIFNEKYADELMVLDIKAGNKKEGLDWDILSKLAAECNMPLCYGGGIKTLEEAKRLISLGIEKLTIGSAAISNIELISSIASEFGSQSISVVVDVRRGIKSGGQYEIYTNNGSDYHNLCFESYLELLDKSGAGEIIINSIDLDGMMTGYDFDLMHIARRTINCQLTALGGAGSLQDLIDLYAEFGLVGAAAGSIFIYKGPYKAVLINYPDDLLKQEIENNFYKKRTD
jgi:imidazole glycerol-phosphate synthase subunit HisF